MMGALMNSSGLRGFTNNDLEKILAGKIASCGFSVAKNNGLRLTGISIPQGDQRAVPMVYLDSLYMEYVNGKNLDSCVGDVADMRIEVQDKAAFINMGLPDILDHEKMKDK